VKEEHILWARMVALEVERKRHDGTSECAGCKPEDIVVLPPLCTDKAVMNVLNEELSNESSL